MAVTRNWISKKTTYFDEIRNIYKAMSLKPCKKITIGFDPFREDSKEIRTFNFLITSYPALKSKLYLPIKTNILCDRSDPIVNVELINGEQILMNCTHLKVKDIFLVLHNHVTPLAEKEEPDVKKVTIKRKIHSKI